MISKSVEEHHKKIKEGASLTTEVNDLFSHIEDKNESINAFISLNKENALKAAEESEKRFKSGSGIRPLEGAIFSVKDMFCVKGTNTTAGSKMLKDFVPAYDATVIERLKEAGAIIVGKTNQDEFAMGSTNETSYFGTCKNPWSLDHVSGGSSGGSAASVAARFAQVSLGTDTGGSVRQPAHFCGTVGLKPTYGRVSRYGVIAFASSLDQTGFFSLKVEDSFKVAQVVSGKDIKDNTTSSSVEAVYNPSETQDLKGFKVGVVKEFEEKEVDDDIKKAIEDSKKALTDRGAELVEVNLPLVDHGVPAYYLIATSEAASNLSRYDGIRYGHRTEKAGEVSLDEFYTLNRSEGFGPEVKRRILLGNFSLSSGYIEAYYRKACQLRRLMREDYFNAFKEVDVILAPVASSTAFKLHAFDGKPLKKFLNDYFTVTVNLAGLPGLTVPVQKDSDGLPIGVQLIANQFKENNLYKAGLCLEESFQFYKEEPNV
jgi:aspartyl-tRNA(Asn)/glutamyl-tRNA(Gln) amidotransferase subunit A